MSEIKIYTLNLGDGFSWHLTATAETRPHLEKYCRIMGLKKAKHAHKSPRIIFNSIHASDGDGMDWKPDRRNPPRLWMSYLTEDIIFETGKEPDDSCAFMLRQALFPVYMEAISKGGFPFHAALVEKDGVGVLIAGCCGAGKSTCSRRIPFPWKALCDDQALILPDGNGGYKAHPMPTWSLFMKPGEERTWDTESSVPLGLICFLEQAHGDAVHPIDRLEKVGRINTSAQEGVYAFCSGGDDDGLKKRLYRELFLNAGTLAQSVPAVELHASKDGKFWEKIDEALAAYIL